MKRIIIVGGALLAALSLTPAAWAQSASAPAAPVTAEQVFARLQSLQSAPDPKAAHAEALALTGSPSFASLPVGARTQAWAMTAALAFRYDDAEQALKDLDNAVSPTAPSIVWQMRLVAADHAADSPAAIESLQTLRRRFPSDLAGVPDDTVLRTVGRPAATPQQQAEQEALAEYLIGAWRPQDPFFWTDALKAAAVRGRLAAGRLQAARALAGEIAQRDLAISLRADRRYEALTADGQWALPTPRAATEAKLAEVRIQRARFPRRLRGALLETTLLGDLDADTEALQVVERALAASKADPKAFDDADRSVSWLEQQRGELLTALGRSKAGEGAMKIGAETSEHGQENVSNLLNLASRLAYDDPKEAVRLTTLAAGRPISDYGRSVGLSARVCAYAHMNDRANAQAAFTDLAALDAKGLAGRTVMGAAWCLGDEAAAARVIITQLADPTRRESAIAAVQADLPPKRGAQTADDLDHDKMIRAVAAREDVRAALTAYGRMIQLSRDDLYRPEDRPQSR